MICDSNGENNFLHKLLLTDIQLARFRQAFANNVSASIKLLNTELCKMTQLGVFLGILLNISLLLNLNKNINQKSSKDKGKLLFNLTGGINKTNRIKKICTRS